MTNLTTTNSAPLRLARMALVVLGLFSLVGCLFYGDYGDLDIDKLVATYPLVVEGTVVGMNTEASGNVFELEIVNVWQGHAAGPVLVTVPNDSRVKLKSGEQYLLFLRDRSEHHYVVNATPTVWNVRGNTFRVTDASGSCCLHPITKEELAQVMALKTPASPTPAQPPRNAEEAMDRMLAAMHGSGSYRIEAEIVGVNDDGPYHGMTYAEWVAPDRLYQRWEDSGGDGFNEVLVADGRFFSRDAREGPWRIQLHGLAPSAPLGVFFGYLPGARLVGEDVVDGVPVYVVAGEQRLEAGRMPEEPGTGSVVYIQHSFEWYISQQDYRLMQTKWRQESPIFHNRLVDGTPVIEEVDQHSVQVFRFYDYGAAITIAVPEDIR